MTFEEFLRNRAPHNDTTRLCGLTASIVHRADGRMVLAVHKIETKDGQVIDLGHYFLIDGDDITDLRTPLLSHRKP
jgi:hypothetical protein